MMKHEWRKHEKELYMPKAKPTLVTIPKQPFITIKGKGNPNQADFSDRIRVLYSIAYAIKMMPKKRIYTSWLHGIYGISIRRSLGFNGGR